MKSRPKLEPVSEEMKQWSGLLAEELSSWPSVTSRPFFSMTAFYRKGKIFALLPRTRSFEIANSVAFKVDRGSAKVSKLLHSDPRITVPDNKDKGWIAFELRDVGDLRDAVTWLDMAYQNCGKRRKE
jgi:hypothetical protein